MADQEKTLQALQALQDLTDKLTLRRIATAMLAGVLALLLFTTYENRTSIIDVLLQGATTPESQREWSVSEKTSSQMVDLVKINPLVSFAFVEKLDLPKNRRIPKFWFVSHEGNSFIVDERMKTKLPEAAFDQDSKNTQQLVSILNNNFVCSKFEDTVFSRYFPELRSSSPYVCSIAIPPFYGRMIGILTFGVTVKPQGNDYDAIRLEATRLSVEIYLHDIAKRGH